MPLHNTRRFHVAGWGLFTLSAILYAVSTARAGDWIGLAASLLFLIACILFIVPILRAGSAGETP